VRPRPLLKKYEHAETAASDGTYLREFNDNNTGICLRGHSFRATYTRIRSLRYCPRTSRQPIAPSPMFSTLTFSMIPPAWF
jgi:hypothetical protein